MKKKIISYGIAHISFDLVRNILRIWYNYKMLILFVIIIGLAFVIFFNFHCFKSFFLSLFIWSYFTKNDRFFVLSTFKAWASVDQSFVSFLMGLFDEGLCDLCWLLLLLREHLSLFSSFSVEPVSAFPIIFGVSAILRFLLSQTLCSVRKPKEALLRYHSSFPWSILIDFRSYFFLFLLFLFMFSSYFSPTVQFNNSIVFIVCCKVCCHFCINTI